MGSNFKTSNAQVLSKMLNGRLSINNVTFQYSHALRKLGDQLHHDDRGHLVDDHHCLGTAVGVSEDTI